MIGKLTAACRQIEAAIRLIASPEDELAIHTIVMATYGILRDLSKGRHYYEVGIKPQINYIGRTRFTNASNFLKHADRDPSAQIEQFDAEETDWRLGFCIILYRDLAGSFTPTMAAFHSWMVIRHPDAFQLEEDEDREIERAYREANQLIQESERDVKLVLLDGLIEAFKSGGLPADIGYRRKPRAFESG